VFHTNVTEASKEGSRGEDHHVGFEGLTEFGDDPTRAPALQDELVDLALDNPEAWCTEQSPLDLLTIDAHVALAPRRAHCWSLAHVEAPILDRRSIGDSSHESAERVDLSDELTLSKPADCRIATHVADCVDVLSHEQRARSQTGEGVGGFGSGMSAADDYGVETGRLHRGAV
jgi:hypothetical protein